MISTYHVVAAARAVRIATIVAVVFLLVAFIAISSFADRYGSRTPLVLGAQGGDTALAVAVSAQESVGLTCSAEPVMTDVVLFQREDTSAVAVLTLDRAVKASSARQGSIRRYCSPT